MRMRILCILLCIFLASCGKRATYVLENGVRCKQRWNDGTVTECSDGATYKNATNVRIVYD